MSAFQHARGSSHIAHGRGRRDRMRIRRFSGVPARSRAEGSHAVDVVLTWNALRPHEVKAFVQGEGYGTRRWVFDVELLVAGMRGPAGLGAVTVLPDLLSLHDDRRVELMLATPDGAVALPLPEVELCEFLASFAPEPSPRDAAA